MKTLVGHTMEIDDVEAAVAEILQALDLEHTLRKNAVGFLTCYSEFIESGVVAALCERLPFDVVGTTTLSSAVPGEYGQLMLTINVLTSDDVRFATGVTTSLAGEQVGPLTEAYTRALSALDGKPAMMVGYLALMLSGDEIIDMLDKITGGVPIFGTVAVDHTKDYATAYTIHNGKAYNDAFAFVLLEGNVEPTFYVASIPAEKIRRQQAIITGSQSNVLTEVNGMPVLDYLQTIGLAKGGQIEGLNAIPFVIEHNDGTAPIVRAIFAITPEGAAVCGGAMPVGATLSIGSIDYDDVTQTTAAMLKAALASGKRTGLQMFSCIGRNLSLGMEPDAEMEIVVSTLGSQIPFQFCYSGGELCPVYDEAGRPVNRFHNDTIVACIL